jgi:8-oxo-dGTP pyrophosphatase MutT (NUDIX family)
MTDINKDAYFDETGLASPFYRVSLKAVVRDDQGRVLVTGEKDGTYELPGGGWDHDEGVETGLPREIQEELGVEVTNIGNPLFVYKGRTTRPHMMMRVAFEVQLASHNFIFNQDDPDEVLAEARFVDRDEFLKLNWSGSEQEIVQHIDKLWPSVDPTPAPAVAKPEDTEEEAMTDNDKISL